MLDPPTFSLAHGIASPQTIAIWNTFPIFTVLSRSDFAQPIYFACCARICSNKQLMRRSDKNFGGRETTAISENTSRNSSQFT
uniref:Uncharacterized protein n=1 Tax=Pristionchus pacificus TaxID=54126 RepID=A0A2A6C795_PRIPA|eukprot:PDM74039.1 hypothetical protein PRIPAC_41395 [Pristionchus pacificus]